MESLRFLTKSPIVKCDRCGEIIKRAKLHCLDPRLFAPIEKTKFPLIKLSKIQEKELIKPEPHLIGEN